MSLSLLGGGQARPDAASALDAPGCPTAAIDASGHILEVNRAWTEAAAAGGADPDRTGVGVSYLTVCDRAAGADAEGAAEAAAGIRAVLGGEAAHFALDYRSASQGRERWFTLRARPLGGPAGGAVVSHLEITLLREAEDAFTGLRPGLARALDPAAPISAVLEGDGTVRQVAERTRALLGMARTGEGADPRARIDQRDVEAAVEALGRSQASPGVPVPVRLRVRDGRGRVRELDLVVTNLLHEPGVEGLVVAGSDVSSARFAQIARRLESHLLQRLPAAVVVTDDRGVVVYWNERSERLFGYARDEAIGVPVGDLDVGPVGDEAARILEIVDRDGRWEGAYDARRKDGSKVPIYVTLERIDDEEIGFHGLVGASVDIADQRRLEADLAFQALHDPLTGLPNRRLFVDHLERAAAHRARQDSLTAVLFLDLDDFKAVNDRIGHDAGDEALRQVAGLLAHAVREGDVVARLGGDEFVICCDEVRDADEAGAIAERVLEALARPVQVEGLRLDVTASIGLAVSPSAEGGEALVRRADAAMYAAKQAGKARIEVFDGELHERERRRRTLAEELRRGAAEGELATWFQPELDLVTGDLFGFEALVRWQHPARGLVGPDAFVDVAEESGVIEEVGRVVLAEACAALARWEALRPDLGLTVSVNVSARQLAAGTVVDELRAELARWSIDPARLCVEVTESTLMDLTAAAEALRTLRSVGVLVAIDDFGTGYSSLSRLKRFPVDFLKIDRSFVSGLGRDPEDEAIVEATITLGRSLELQMIAEGVETPVQLDRLQALGCDYGQGFLWARPLAVDAATDLVRQGGPPLHP